MEANITIKNYRCFEDTKPLKIKLENGFISLVGQNNSGKSSFLKLFYELRSIWSKLSSINNIKDHLNSNNPIHSNSIGLYDPSEIFTDTNERPISIEIDITSKPPLENKISSIHLKTQHTTPANWTCLFFYGSDKKQIKDFDRIDKISINTLRLLKQRLKIECDDFLRLMQCLADCVYIGAFRNAINEGSGNYYDLDIGTSFIQTWNKWKTGTIKEQNIRIQNVTEDIRKIFNFNSLEINASQDQKTLQIVTDGNPYTLREVGAGIAQFIIVLGNIAIQNPSFILIDEPELNLHPSLQIDFLLSLASYAQNGVIFSTHSIGLARSTSEHIYSFQKKNNKTEVKSFEKTINYTEFIGEMSFSSYQDMGFNKLLLVEGVTDVKTIQQFLRKIKKDHKILIIPLGGNQLANGQYEMELTELKRITPDIYCIVDSERNDEKNPPIKERIDFQKICEKLDFTICITQKRSIENYLSDRAIKSVLGEEYTSLEPYQKLSDCSEPWHKSKNWQIAREMNWNEIKDTDVGKFLNSL